MSIIRFPVKVLVDTSIYIPFINKGVSNPVLEAGIEKPMLYMSAVVMEELYAGAQDLPTVRLLDRMYETYEKLGRFVVPSTSDWQKAGKIVSKLGKKYGFEHRYLTRMQNDTLIALCARQIGSYLVTRNTTDFLRIKEFLDYKLYPEK